MEKSGYKYDVVIIGGGPAGMMAAGRAAELGARVLLIEKNDRLGIKLLMTGHSRSNLTNDLPVRDFIKQIGLNGKFLFSSLSKFGPQELQDFFSERGLPLKVENKNRVFPISDRATDVLAVLKNYLDEGKVEIRYSTKVRRFKFEDGQIAEAVLEGGATVRAKNFILSTGGLSYPATGSTGDGYDLAGSCGHEIVEPRPGLAAINLFGVWIKQLEGLSLDQVALSLAVDGEVAAEHSGDLMFTATGISGPLAHDMSREVARISEKKDCRLHLDLLPNRSLAEIEESLQEIFHKDGNKQLKNGLSAILPSKLVPILIKIAQLEGGKQQNEMLKEERERLALAIKNIELHVASLAGFDKANVTVGGVALEEVDPKTMRSKIISNLFLAGEVLDLDGPTGGYNLQICWSTGFAAGEGSTNG